MVEDNGSENSEASQDGATENLDAETTANTAPDSEVTAEVSQLKDHQAVLEAELAAVQGQLDQANATLESVTAERDSLAKKLAALEDKPRVRRAERSQKLRAVGPVKDQFAPRDLLELINGAGSVELVFSDGKKELPIEPRVIEGKSWGITAIGLALRVPEFLVSGPSDKPVTLAGYGLFIEGQQVAWAARSDKLEVAPGRRMDLKNDVVFTDG